MYNKFYINLPACKVPEAANVSSSNSAKEIKSSAVPAPNSAVPSKSSLNLPPPVPPRTNHSHHVTTTYITQDEVTVSTSSSMCGNNATTNAASGAAAAAGVAATSASADQVQISVVSNDPKKKNEILKLRDMLLTDNSVESS